VLLGAAGLLVSASKGGLIAGMCGSLAFAALAWSARRAAVASTWKAKRRVLGPLLLVAALALGGLGAKTVLPRLQRAAGSESHSAAFRAYTWRGTLAMANSSPLLGQGPGSFPTDFPRFQQAGYTRSAHQSWLQIAAESGWPSLVFLLGAVGFGLARAFKYLGDSARPHRAWVAAGGAGSLVAGLVHGMMDAGWGLLSIALLFAVVLALLDAPADESNAPSTAQAEARPLALGWLLAVLPLAGAASYGLKAQGAENAHVTGRDIAEMSESQRTEALRQAKFATEDVPLDARAWANVALLKEATGDAAGAAGDYRQAARIQPSKALYPRRLAELFESAKSPSQAREFFDKAAALEPKDTSLLLERARFRAKNGDAKGAREDYAAILSLQESPLGKYPATPELVNGDFNRARLALARAAVASGDTKQARELAKRGLEEVQAARESAKANAAMIEAVTMYGDALAPPSPDELREQERTFKSIFSQQ
jgi:tetratricopeptide (TPR) repeat protein